LNEGYCNTIGGYNLVKQIIIKLKSKHMIPFLNAGKFKTLTAYKITIPHKLLITNPKSKQT